MRTKHIKCKLLVFTTVVLLLFCLSIGQLVGRNGFKVSAESVELEDDENVVTEEDGDIIFSYLDIFEVYYNSASEYDQDFEERYSFDEFVNGYYENNLPIDEYTNSVLYGISTYDSSTGGEFDGGGASGDDAYYILKSSQNPDKSVTPQSDFFRKPVYSTFDYSIIHEGDIIYETQTVFFDIGHSALVYDIDKNSAYGNYIQTIDAVGGGVQYGYLDDSRMVDFGVKILRVYGATSTVIANVKTFNLGQLGKPYSVIRLPSDYLHTSYNSTEWYCSELIYASYLASGIDIGNGVTVKCVPDDIYKSPNTYEIADAHFLALSVINKNNGSWSIKIQNTSDHVLTIYYNSKMCFKDDAQKWINLSNVISIVVSANSSAIVQISENVFATSIAVSYISNGYRLITYADNLSTSNQLKFYYSLVTV